MLTYLLTYLLTYVLSSLFSLFVLIPELHAITRRPAVLNHGRDGRQPEAQEFFVYTP